MTRSDQARGQPQATRRARFSCVPCPKGSGTFELVAGTRCYLGRRRKSRGRRDPVDLPIDLTGNVNAIVHCSAVSIRQVPRVADHTSNPGMLCRAFFSTVSGSGYLGSNPSLPANFSPVSAPPLNRELEYVLPAPSAFLQK